MNLLRRADNPDAQPYDAHTEYVGEIAGHRVTGAYNAARRGIDLIVHGDAKRIGSGLLIHQGGFRYVGELTIGDESWEAVAEPVGCGIRRHWAVSLHPVLGETT